MLEVLRAFSPALLDLRSVFPPCCCGVELLDLVPVCVTPAVVFLRERLLPVVPSETIAVIGAGGTYGADADDLRVAVFLDVLLLLWWSLALAEREFDPSLVFPVLLCAFVSLPVVRDARLDLRDDCLPLEDESFSACWEEDGRFSLVPLADVACFACVGFAVLEAVRSSVLEGLLPSPKKSSAMPS